MVFKADCKTLTCSLASALLLLACGSPKGQEARPTPELPSVPTPEAADDEVKNQDHDQAAAVPRMPAPQDAATALAPKLIAPPTVKTTVAMADHDQAAAPSNASLAGNSSTTPAATTTAEGMASASLDDERRLFVSNKDKDAEAAKEAAKDTVKEAIKEAGKFAAKADEQAEDKEKEKEKEKDAAKDLEDKVADDEAAENEISIPELTVDKDIDSLSFDADKDSPKPIDYASLFWLGDGYDALSGERRATCLDSDKVEFRSYPINQALDTLDLAVNREELSRKLNVEMNAEASGTWEAITATPSVKASILRETEITTSSVVALARFRYVKNRVSLYQSPAPLSPERLADLQADKSLFREQCGDKFTRSIRTGAELILVINAQQVKNTRHSASQISHTVKLGFGNIVGINQSQNFTNDEKEILESFRISTRCYTNGASAQPCGDNDLNLTGVTMSDAGIISRINAAKKTLAADIDEGKNVVVLDEELETYPVPAAERGKAPEQVFFDYQAQLSNIQKWLKLESKTQLICDSVHDLENACDLARDTIAGAIAACADFTLWPRGQCRAPHADDLSHLLAQSDAGSVVLYEHGSRRGRQLRLEFNDIYDRESWIKPNVLYDLGEQRFQVFVDILSCVDTDIKNGWRLIFYEHPDGSGRQWSIDSGVKGYTNVGRGFNDKASAFRLVRVEN